jgi:hypothetical protein
VASPRWQREVVEAVLADLQQPRAIDVRLDIRPAPGGEGLPCGEELLWVSEPGVLGAAAFERCMLEPGPSALVLVADWLQDFFLESRGAWGETRPACPRHSHPAQAELLHDEAWWMCPTAGHRLAPIGQLGR